MKLLLIGHGKMGKLIEQLAPEYDAHITKICDASTPPEKGTFQDVDAMIDFSGPEGILERIELGLSQNVPLVIGTTGWDENLEAAKKLVLHSNGAMIYSPNFSLGVALFFKMIRQATKCMAPFSHYDVALLEEHHREKKDHPSGTAKRCAQIILDEHPSKKKIVSNLSEGAIEKEALHVGYTRLGTTIGRHTVCFDGPDDTITLTHNAKSRNDFARGALVAAKWIIGKKGIFTVDDLI